MNRGSLLSGIFCGSLLLGMASAQQPEGKGSAKPWDMLLGKWKQVPGPDEGDLLRVEAEGPGVKFSFGCRQGGSCPDVRDHRGYQRS